VRKLNPLIVLAFLLGVGTVAIFETLLSFQASQCTPQEQRQNSKTPNDGAKPSDRQKSDRGSGEQEHKTVSEPFVCTIGGFPTATRVFMDQNEGFFIGSFTLLLVVVTAWLVWATIKLWRGAEETGKPQLRAYQASTAGLYRRRRHTL
jgi:hypothetical protein